MFPISSCTYLHWNRTWDTCCRRVKKFFHKVLVMNRIGRRLQKKFPCISDEFCASKSVRLWRIEIDRGTCNVRKFSTAIRFSFCSWVYSSLFKKFSAVIFLTESVPNLFFLSFWFVRKKSTVVDKQDRFVAQFYTYWSVICFRINIWCRRRVFLQLLTDDVLIPHSLWQYS